MTYIRTTPESPEPTETVEVHHEVDSETLVFATDADSEAHALAVDEHEVDLLDDDLVIERAFQP